MACEIPAHVTMLARLVIHAGQAVSGRFTWMPLSWRALASDRPRGPAMTNIGVRVEDLQGRRYFDAENARSPIDLALPAGTYHVMFRLGEMQRRYTVALEQGSTVELRLPQATERA